MVAHSVTVAHASARALAGFLDRTASHSAVTPFVTALKLMTALNPPTRASEPDASGKRHREHRPGSLGTEPMDPPPCEAPDGHPVLAHLPRFHVRGTGERLLEEAYDWARDLTDAECMQCYLVGLDVNLAFGAAANDAVVGRHRRPCTSPARSSTQRCPVPGWSTSPTSICSG